MRVVSLPRGRQPAAIASSKSAPQQRINGFTFSVFNSSPLPKHLYFVTTLVFEFPTGLVPVAGRFGNYKL
jgi:hypothetical protein